MALQLPNQRDLLFYLMLFSMGNHCLEHENFNALVNKCLMRAEGPY